MIETALKHTAGRRRDAAVLLGWGRNTLTRKIKELGMKVDGGDDDEGDDALNLRPTEELIWGCSSTLDLHKVWRPCTASRHHEPASGTAPTPETSAPPPEIR
jgi:hypothetical protein